MKTTPVLIIEDTEVVGKFLQLLLGSKRIKADWIIGLQDQDPFQGNTVRALQPDFVEVDISLSDYAVALVDGDLLGGGPQGWDIVPVLREHGIICVAISGDPDSQKKLIAAGAEFNHMKPIPGTWLDENIPKIIELHASRSAE